MFTAKPPPRSGHTLVSYDGKLILFGGVHDDVHLNDTWVFDPSRHGWTRLQCEELPPEGRQGHVAVVIQDIMYVYGGRGALGRLIGELIGLRLSGMIINHYFSCGAVGWYVLTSPRAFCIDNTWLSFDDFESRPTGRIGHSMSCSGSKLFLIGGEGEVHSSRKITKNNAVYTIDTGESTICVTHGHID